MRTVLLFLGFLLSTTTTVPAWASNQVGFTQIQVTSATRGKNLDVTVWYPANEGGERILLGENRLFEGTAASRNAPIASGRHPLIVISHGSGGRIENMGWIASYLVKAGFVVAGPNHPGTMGGDSTPVDTPKLWERTQDLTDLVSAMTTVQKWSGSIDGERIGVLGFSLGGAAAMQISGARADLEAYARYCDSYMIMSDCLWYAGGQGYVDGEAVPSEVVDLRKVDKEHFEQSNRDPRVKSAVLIDPALAQAYDEDSLKSIDMPMNFINLGRADSIPVAVSAKKLSELTPKQSYALVDGAVHFSFLGECKKDGAQLLKSIGEKDTLCDDGGGRTRADIHAELGRVISQIFIHDLKAAK